MERELRKTTVTIANPLYDGWATAGLSTLRDFPKGTVFAVMASAAGVDGVKVLWGNTAHLRCLTDAPKVLDLLEQLTNNSAPSEPVTFNEAMLIIDPYFDGIGCAPTVAEVVLDSIIRGGVWDTPTMLDILKTAYEAQAKIIPRVK